MLDIDDVEQVRALLREIAAHNPALFLSEVKRLRGATYQAFLVQRAAVGEQRKVQLAALPKRKAGRPKGSKNKSPAQRRMRPDGTIPRLGRPPGSRNKRQQVEGVLGDIIALASGTGE
jgi:hypothetical protein